MPHWAFDVIQAIGVIVTLLVTVMVQRSAKAEMQGAAGARLTSVEKDVDDLKDEQDMQWSKLNQHGERISKLEGTVRPH
jgi:hypothetical protein